MEGDSNKKLTPPWFMGWVAGDKMSGSLFWSFTYNASSCKWLYVCIILFIIYECFFYFNGKSFLWLKQVDLRVHNRSFSVTQAQFLGTSIHVGVVSELLSCPHCCTVQPQEPHSRDAEGLQTWFCGHISYSEVTLRKRVMGKPVRGIRWQQPDDGTPCWVRV